MFSVSFDGIIVCKINTSGEKETLVCVLALWMLNCCFSYSLCYLPDMAEEAGMFMVLQTIGSV